MNSHIEENYLKAIYKLSLSADGSVSTSGLAAEMGVQSATVTDMLKKLSAKKMINYQKYHGVELSKTGLGEAVRIVRKHRLWEVFLVEKLGFGWGEVHEVAEQLEHVKSEQLIDSLDAFLDYPKVDPHGDPIPDKDGVVRKQPTILLTALKPGDAATITAVKHDGKDLLDYLDRHNLVLDQKIKVIEVLLFDGSMQLSVADKVHYVSEKIAGNILVVKG
jgi:DtxR family Mn-dependent transcriptional regulator